MRLLIPGILAMMFVLGTSPAVFASTAVPFNGSGSGTFAFTSQTTLALSGTGHYTHLGLTTLSFIGTISPLPAACAGGFNAVEQDTYIAANGDKVYLTVNDVLCPTSAAGVFSVIGSFTVTGGTGRFADASGSGTITASTTFITGTSGTFSGTTAGTISY
jgi:hypothetical protein